MIRNMDCTDSRPMARYSDRYCYLDGGNNTTTTQASTAPSSFAQPYLTDLMTQAKTLYNQGSQYAPFNTVAPFSDQTIQGLNMATQRAQNGSPVTNAADGTITNLLQSNTPPPGQDILSQWSNPQNINPYLTGQFNAASKPVIDAVNAQFSNAGRTGSVANQDALTSKLGDLSANIFGNGYDAAANRSVNAANSMNTAATQQGNQKVAAATLAPSLAGQDWTNIQNQLQAGQAYDTQGQNYINDALARWNFGQDQPWNLLAKYAGSLNGYNLGSTQTGTNTAPTQSAVPGILGAGVNLLASQGSNGGSLFSNLLGY